MGAVERLFSLLLSVAMVLFGTSYFQEYRYGLGRWVIGGMLFMGAVCALGCLVEWYEARAAERSLERLCLELANRRR